MTVLHKRKRSRAATVTEFSNSPSFHKAVFRVSSLQTSHYQQQYHIKKSKKRNDLDDTFNVSRHQSTVSDFAIDFEEYPEQSMRLWI